VLASQQQEQDYESEGLEGDLQRQKETAVT
jgi:hypothetical protein